MKYYSILSCQIPILRKRIKTNWAELKDTRSVQTFFSFVIDGFSVHSTEASATTMSPLQVFQIINSTSWVLHILTTCCVSKVCDEWMRVWQVYGLHSVCGTKSNTVMSEELHNGTTTLSETAHIMPWCSPLKQGIMLQNNYIGGWNDLVWSPHLVIIIIIIIIICLYILFTDSKTPCCSFS